MHEMFKIACLLCLITLSMAIVALRWLLNLLLMGSTERRCYHTINVVNLFTHMRIRLFWFRSSCCHLLIWHLVTRARRSRRKTQTSLSTVMLSSSFWGIHNQTGFTVPENGSGSTQGLLSGHQKHPITGENVIAVFRLLSQGKKCTGGLWKITFFHGLFERVSRFLRCFASGRDLPWLGGNCPP